MIEWTDTFEKQLREMSDEELLRAFDSSPGEPGDPVFDAYSAEIERRNLDI